MKSFSRPATLSWIGGCAAADLNARERPRVQGLGEQECRGPDIGSDRVRGSDV